MDKVGVKWAASPFNDYFAELADKAGMGLSRSYYLRDRAGAAPQLNSALKLCDFLIQGTQEVLQLPTATATNDNGRRLGFLHAYISGLCDVDERNDIQKHAREIKSGIAEIIRTSDLPPTEFVTESGKFFSYINYLMHKHQRDGILR